MGTNKPQKYSKQTNQKQAKGVNLREPLMAAAGRI
jgi:hypothetical protein